MNRQFTPDQIFVQLVNTYLDRVFRYLVNLTRDQEVSRDLCHETFLNLRKQVDQGTNVGEAYVFTTARNTALSRWRSDKREESRREAWGQNHVPPAGSTSAAAENNELQRALHDALSLLSEGQRSVFLLSEVEGLKYEQIATVLGISAGTVASRKFKAVRILRDELRRLGHAMP